MGKSRLEAFSDGVIAIIITIMVLELKVPHGAALENLFELAPIFFSYVLSFIYVGTMWNNHHHLFHTVHKVTGGIMWANLHLLFWLSLLPFTTSWMGENFLAKWPMFLYAFNMFALAMAHAILVFRIKAVHRGGSDVDRAIGSDFKRKISLVANVCAVVSAFFAPLLCMALTVAVALIWLIPDSRIEQPSSSH